MREKTSAIPPIISHYMFKHYLVSFCVLLIMILSIVWLGEMVELLRRSSNKPDIGFGLVLRMSILKLPETGQEVFPFVVLFAAMYSFWHLTRTQELIVVRAVGISIWQFLAPILVAAFLIGIVKQLIINPVGSNMIAKFEELERFHLHGRVTFELSGSGLWLRQASDEGYVLLRAKSVSPGQSRLKGVLMLVFTPDDRYEARIDADYADLKDGYWEIHNAWINKAESEPLFMPITQLKTALTSETIEESFSSPETVSFLELRGFIRTLEATGFPPFRHQVHYQWLLAQPFMFCAMVLFAAAFSLRQSRRGGAAIMAVSGVMVGLTIFVLDDLSRTLGASEVLPPMVAAWTPAVVSLLVGSTILLHMEDG